MSRSIKHVQEHQFPGRAYHVERSIKYLLVGVAHAIRVQPGLVTQKGDLRSIVHATGKAKARRQYPPPSSTAFFLTHAQVFSYAGVPGGHRETM